MPVFPQEKYVGVFRIAGHVSQTPDGHEELPVSRQKVAPSSGDIQLQVLRAASLSRKPGEK